MREGGGSVPLVPPHLRERQVRASDPALSIWVSANAGSGKTHVLTQRVIRLLLAGVPPSRILCLTFTKAAAAQMATRVFRDLSTWTMAEDRDLRAAIVRTGAPAPGPDELLRARRLFTRTVETPGGLKIQTIHAFCERLLHLFPFEANVPARFVVAEEMRADELLAAAKREVIAAAQRSPGPLGAALALVADLAGASGVDRLLAEAQALRVPAARATASRDDLIRRLGGGRYPDAEAVSRAMVEGGLGPPRWGVIADQLASGTKSDGEKAACFRRAVAGHEVGAGPGVLLDLLRPVYFTADGKPRKTIVTAGLARACPGLKDDLSGEQTRLAALRDELKIVETAERSAALLLLTEAVARRYEAAKAAGGLLDFDDLVERTRQLLRRSDAGWVLHKLDSGIDHVLVDEAQDTSEAQWQILEHLTADFAAGAGARRVDRSFFVVGDDKQSIFSFQGAAPLMFERMRSAFESRFRGGGKPFERVRLQTSFRSTAGILAAVDGVFRPAPHQDGLVQTGDVWPGHESIRAGLPALIELWPRIGSAPPADDGGEWTIPVDAIAADDPANQLAERVAWKVADLCAPLSMDRVHDGGRQRPVTPGDILILVRTRNAFFEAVIRALKKRRVAVAGADRLDVANHIAVKDLVAAGRAALLPDDDLSLACVLKSPLFGLDDDDLIALAPGRGGPLLAALRQSGDARHREAHATLARWRARAAIATPFAFYVELLGRDGGRRRMEARLGPEAHDAIDEFLRLALQHERESAPSLGSFLDGVEALESSIKRDMENAADAVRVMTVHAAKGLEAKIVFLPDTCSVPAATLDPTVFDLAAAVEGEAPLLAWSPRKGDDPPAVTRARDAQRQATMREYRRLLYVAMTRAEERLYLSGFFRLREPPEDCWDAMIRAAFEADAPEGTTMEQVSAFWDRAEHILRITAPGEGEAATPIRRPHEQAAMDLPPPWLGRPAPDESPPPLRFRPSNLDTPDVSGARRAAILYGTTVHALLQHLPELDPSDRDASGRAFLQQAGLPAELREAALAEALGVLACPALAPLFGPGSRAEVALAGRVPRADGSSGIVEGTADRVAVGDDVVFVADFKTGPVQSIVPARYVSQLALYRRLLQPLYSGREIRALLIWTKGAQVIALDESTLDAAVETALAGLAASEAPPARAGGLG